MLTPAAAERGDTYVVLETTHKKRSRADEDTYRDFLLERVATAYLGVLPGRLSQKEACRQVPALQRWQCARSIYRLIEEAHDRHGAVHEGLPEEWEGHSTAALAKSTPI